MAVSTDKLFILDYTTDVENLVTAINALTTAVTNRPDYTTLLERIATACEGVKNSSDDLNVILTGMSTILQGIETTETASNDIQTEIALSISQIEASLLDPTKGINTKMVDIPYQGNYQKAMTRMSMTESGQVAALVRAVQEEAQDPLFPHA